MSPLRLAGAFLVAALLTFPSALEAAGRIRGSVVDPEGGPIPGVRVTVTARQLPTFRQVVTTNARGVFTLGFSRGELRYTYVLEKDGFEALKRELNGPGTQTQRQTFVLTPSVRQAPVQQIPDENEAIADYNAGLQSARDGDLEAAEARFREAMETEESFIPAYSALARIYLDRKDFAAAAATAEMALARAPTDAEALRVSYDAYRSLGDKAKASEMAQALRAAEQGVAAAATLYNEAADAYTAGDLGTALAKFQEAVELDPTLAEAHYAVANLQLQNRNFAAAAAAAERGLALAPDDRKLLAAAHDAYAGLGEVDKARDVLTRLNAGESAADLLARAAELFNAGQIEQARPLLEEVLRLDPTAASAHYLLGIYYAGKNDKDSAREHLRRFIETAPDDPEVATAKEMLRYLDQ